MKEIQEEVVTIVEVIKEEDNFNRKYYAISPTKKKNKKN